MPRDINLVEQDMNRSKRGFSREIHLRITLLFENYEKLYFYRGFDIASGLSIMITITKNFDCIYNRRYSFPI